MLSQPQCWGPFVILHPDPLDTIQEQETYPEPAWQSQQTTKPTLPRKREPQACSRMCSVRCDHQDKHPEIDEEIIDLYSAGWKTESVRRDTPETRDSSETTTCVSSWDDSSDSDTLRPASAKGLKKAVRACKGRLKQMRSKENLLGLSGKSSQSSLPLVRISSVSKLERHYGYTSPELQKIGIDSSSEGRCRSQQSYRKSQNVSRLHGNHAV